MQIHLPGGQNFDIFSVFVALMIFLGTVATGIKAIRDIKAFSAAFIKELKEFLNVRAELKKIAEKTDAIAREMQPNGGGSIRDAINGARGDLAGVKHDVGRIKVRLEGHMEFTDVPIWECDERGALVNANRKYLEIVGRGWEEVAGYNWKNTLYPDDVDPTTARWAQVVADGRDSEISYRVLRPDGTQIPVRANASVQKDAEGKVIGWIGNLVVSVSDPTRIRTALAEPKRKKRILFVEDGHDSRDWVKLALSNEFDVEAHAGGQSAAQEFRAARDFGHDFDLVLSDYSMPVMDGAQLARAIRNDEKHFGRTPIVFWTGVEVPEAIVKECRILAVWSKVLDADQLLQKVREVLKK